MLAVLFTETGLMPVRIRRLLLALGRLEYMLSTDPESVVHSALLNTIALFREGKPGWATDLAIMLRCLPTAIMVGADDLFCAETIGDVKKKVISVVDADLQRDIDILVKTHLLRNRLEMCDQQSLTLVTRRLRHYLTMVTVPAHRKAMTSLLLGDHNLSVERLRYPARYRDAVPRDHTFACPRLVNMRTDFLAALNICDTALRDAYMKIPNYDFMLKLISSRKAVQVFAKYICLVLGLFDESPRYFPVVLRIPS
ncbi:hypothetical protein B0H19DRAFT_1271009 [Mycena capillaripes]|nr:hypothetical protein B0H19DRAFT_1271009 [Mycena capillaripes]